MYLLFTEENVPFEHRTVLARMFASWQLHIFSWPRPLFFLPFSPSLFSLVLSLYLGHCKKHVFTKKNVPCGSSRSTSSDVCKLASGERYFNGRAASWVAQASVARLQQ